METMRIFFLQVAVLAIISGSIAALPCNSRLRKIRPDLFNHCGNTCPYGQWSSWTITTKLQSDKCDSNKAYNQTRTRYSFIKTCPSENETRSICQPTIDEKALLFIKALDLGLTLPPTGTPPTTQPPRPSTNQSPSTRPPATTRSTQTPSTRPPSTTRSTQTPSARSPSTTRSTQTPFTGAPGPSGAPGPPGPHCYSCGKNINRTIRSNPIISRQAMQRSIIPSTLDPINTLSPRRPNHLRQWPSHRSHRRKRQMQHCPTDVHKICGDNSKRKRKDTQNLLREIPNDRVQTIPILDTAIIPEPFDLNYYLDTVQSHRRKRRMTSNSTCNDRYLLLMLDTSGSIGKNTFNRMVTNLSELVFFFCGNTKIAAMTFGSHIYHEFCFKCDDVNRIDKIKDAIKSIPYHGGGTKTGEAVKCACDNILTIPCGLPKKRKYRKCPAPIDVVIITDGKSNGNLDVCKEAQCLHSHPFYDISTFSISVGRNPNENELDCIENLDNDDIDHIFFDVDSFDELEELIGKVFEHLITPIDPTSDNPTYHLCYDLNVSLDP